jgi:hypothetical protein
MRGARRSCALVLVAACANDPRPDVAEPEAPTEALPAALRPIPTDRAGMLAELAPLPAPALVVVYDVTGPAGLAGTLEVLAATGGWRRENWSLRLPVAGRDHELRGSSVRTPDVVWQAPDEAPGRLAPARLGAVADAIVALDPTTRARVIELVRDWRSDLDAARREHPGTVDTIAGIECVRVPVGTGEVCTWEATGLPLRYEGPSFAIVARHVDREPTLGASAFAIPAGAERTTGAPFDVLARVAAVARGDRSALAELVLADELPGARALP